MNEASRTAAILAFGRAEWERDGIGNDIFWLILGNKRCGYVCKNGRGKWIGAAIHPAVPYEHFVEQRRGYVSLNRAKGWVEARAYQILLENP